VGTVYGNSDQAVFKLLLLFFGFGLIIYVLGISKKIY